MANILFTGSSRAWVFPSIERSLRFGTQKLSELLGDAGLGVVVSAPVAGRPVESNAS